MQMPKRAQISNKGTFGKVLNIAGSVNYIGSAYLSSISALKVGCGYVTLASTPNVIDAVSKLTPDLVFKYIDKIKNTLKIYHVISVGCGFSREKQSLQRFKMIINELETLELPVVIDADGLNILAEVKTVPKLKNLVITPHPKEASNLLNTTVADVLNSPTEAATTLSRKYNCVTVLKLHETLVCDKELNIYKNQTGNSALAKAGSGDVLCGMIAGLLAQKMSNFEAAKLGVYLHGLAGELASKELTEYGVLASDLLNYIPAAISKLA